MVKKGSTVYDVGDMTEEELMAMYADEEESYVKFGKGKTEEPAGHTPIFDCTGADQMVTLFPFVNARKYQEFVELPQAHFRGIIVINEGVSATERFPNVDQKIVFETLELRDLYWDKMKEKLTEAGYDLFGLSE